MYKFVTDIGEEAFKGFKGNVFLEVTEKPSGFHELWRYMVEGKIYWGGEWHYDASGNPVPNK